MTDSSPRRNGSERVVYIGENDDPDSVLHLVKSASRHRVKLVVGRAGSTMGNPVDLKRLARQKREFPAEIEIVSRNRVVRELARDEGLPAASSLDGRGPLRALIEYPFRTTMRAIQQAGARSEDRAAGVGPGISLDAFLGGPVLLTGLVAAAVWGLFYFVFPTTEVSIAPEAFVKEVEIQALADPSVRLVSLDPPVMPGRIIEVEVEGFRAIPATGRDSVPGARASGTVTLRNLTAGSVIVPAGTTVSTSDAVRFATAVEIDLPPSLATAEAEEPSGVVVAVTAVNGGSGGNAPSGSVAEVEGPLRFSVAIASSGAMSGGADVQVSRATEQDQIELRNVLLAQLVTEGQARLELAADADEVVSIWPAGPLNPTITETTFSQPEEPGDLDVGLSLKIKVFATAFDRSDADRLVNAALTGERQDGDSEFDLAEGSVAYGEPVVDRVVGGKVAMRVTGRGTVVNRVNTEEIRASLIDITVADADAYLQRVGGLAHYDLNHWGPLTDRTARLPFRLRVNVMQDAGSGP